MKVVNDALTLLVSMLALCFVLVIAGVMLFVGGLVIAVSFALLVVAVVLAVGLHLCGVDISSYIDYQIYGLK